MADEEDADEIVEAVWEAFERNPLPDLKAISKPPRSKGFLRTRKRQKPTAGAEKLKKAWEAIYLQTTRDFDKMVELEQLDDRVIQLAHRLLRKLLADKFLDYSNGPLCSTELCSSMGYCGT